MMVRELANGSGVKFKLNPMAAFVDLVFGAKLKGIHHPTNLEPLVVFSIDVPRIYAENVMIALHTMVQVNFRDDLFEKEGLSYGIFSFSIPEEVLALIKY